MAGGAQQRYPRLPGVDGALQRRPLTGGGSGGGGSSWLGGILGPPIFDETKVTDTDFDVDLSGFQDGNVLRGTFMIRSTSVGGGHDESRIAFNSDTTDNNYDYGIQFIGGDSATNNSRAWPFIPNADVDADIWFTGHFEIISYSSVIKQQMMTFGVGGAKGAADVVMIQNRRHVAEALVRLQIIMVNGDTQTGSRLTIWQE